MTIPVLLVLLLVPVVVDLLRRPTFRRLAFRNISRRRGEAALVILGSLLGGEVVQLNGIDRKIVFGTETN